MSIVLGKDNELQCQDVMLRDDILETPTGLKKTAKFCYISVDGYDGAVMRKSDIKKLMKWCERQLNDWDEDE